MSHEIDQRRLRVGIVCVGRGAFIGAAIASASSSSRWTDIKG